MPALLVALLSLLLLAAPAGASTVAVGDGVVRVQGEGTEANEIEVAVENAEFIAVDRGAKLTAGAGCTAQSDGSVRCAGAGGPGVTRAVDLGAGNDVLTVRVLPDGISINGGPGDDNLEGSNNDDIIDGGGGRDTINAGLGNDTVTDGDGATPDVDTLDAGPGEDLLSFASRTKPVSADLTLGTDSDGEKPVSFENLLGGKAGDYLIGDGAENRIEGGLGADRLVGNGGADELYGSGGRDLLEGGAGDDLVSGGADADTVSGDAGSDLVDPGPKPKSKRDAVFCGLGNDVVLTPDVSAELDTKCERVRTTAKGAAALTVSYRPRRSGSSLLYTATSPKTIKLRLTLHDARGRRVGTATTTRVRAAKRVRIRLTPAGARAVRSGATQGWTLRAFAGTKTYRRLPTRP
jgi:Ca2+-binding RTX toxin-like protein